MRTLLSIALVLCLAACVHGQSSIDSEVRNSFLSLSAFECSVVAADPKETARLFTLGLNAGRQFLEFVQSNKDVYDKMLTPKIAILWNMTSGPSPDFILGQIYADRTQEMYKDFSSDAEVWNAKKANLYRTKNCALIGK